MKGIMIVQKVVKMELVKEIKFVWSPGLVLIGRFVVEVCRLGLAQIQIIVELLEVNLLKVRVVRLVVLLIGVV